MLKFLSLLSLLMILVTSLSFAQGKGGKGGGDKGGRGDGGSKGGGKGKGGLSGSGGGGGVICFANVTDATDSDFYLKQNKQLPKALLEKGKLQVLETWEMEQTNQAIWNALPEETWEQHLEKVKNAIRDRFPIFMYRLDQTADWTKFADWQDVQDLPVLDDATPMKPIPEHCRRVQLVIRYSEGNNAIGDGPVTVAPEIKISFVKEYFAHLSVTDQAVLMFHEQLYVLGQSIGHNSSDAIRGFNRLFFSNSINGLVSDEQVLYRSPAERSIRNYLIRYLGDYVIYFHETNIYKPGAPFSSQRHFYTYLQLMLKQRQQIGQCIQTAEKKRITDHQCVPQVMKKFESSVNLTAEEAFVMIVVYVLEPHAGYNTDQVLDPSGRKPERYVYSLTRMCESIQNNADQSMALVRKATGYCQEAVLFHGPRK